VCSQEASGKLLGDGTGATMLHLDGSTSSGSGTIVRFGVALAALAGQELEITNVRAKRDHPGLRPQHLTAVRAIAELVQGSLEGDVVDSRRIRFQPGPLPAGGSYQWDIGTAGSTTMLALAILPVAAFASGACTFRLSGGLFQDYAPSAFHFQHALLPLLRRMGLKADLRVVRPGYVPAGAGVIELEVQPVLGKLEPLKMVKPASQPRFWGISLASRLRERKVAQRMADSCQTALRQRGAEISTLDDDTAQQAGAGLAVFAEGPGTMIGADRAGALRRSAESIGRYVARSLLEDLDTGATVDRHLADQLIIFAALAEGTSEFLIPSVTDHVQTNGWLVETILGARTEISGRLLRIHGVGYERRA
jgi:RNA 3'-terminal phosphate cyclase (ATP)